MRTLRQDYVSIPLSSGCSILRRVLCWRPSGSAAGNKELSETANPITECDRVRSYAAPGPPIGAPALIG